MSNYSCSCGKIIRWAAVSASLELFGIRRICQTSAMGKTQHSTQSDQMLIDEVKKHSFLYNRKHHNFSNVKMKKRKWEDIGGNVGLSGMEAKIRWTNIRDIFNRSLRLVNQARITGVKKCHVRPYKYTEQLEFLLPHMTVRDAEDSSWIPEDSNDANVDREQDKSEESDDNAPTQVALPLESHTPQHQRNRRRKTQNQKDEPDIKMNHNNPSEDRLDTFFRSICSTVRTLPPVAQARLRFQITELVFKEEMLHLTSDDADEIPRVLHISECDSGLAGSSSVPSSKKKEASNGEEVPAKKAKFEPAAEAKEEVYTTDRTSESGKAPNLKISAWNIGGMKAWIKKGGIDYINKESPDIFFAQETKVDAAKPPPEAALEDYHITYNAAEKKGYSGVALFSKKKPINVTCGIGIEEHDKEGRVITAEYDSFYFIGVYIPNSSRGLVRLDYRQEWDKVFLEYIKKLDAKKPVIICGDMNVAHEEIDLKNPKSNRNKTPGFTDQEREGFTALLDAGFVDSFRHLYPEQTDAYSFWSYMGNCRAKNVGWRLDYGVISKALVPKLCDNQMRLQTFGSDHCPIVLSMAM